MAPGIRPNGPLLEIGCASGERLAMLQAGGWTGVLGIEMVPSAAARARERGIEVIDGRVEDALARIPSAAYSVVIASMVLEHLADPFSVVRQIGRVLKKDGIFLFSTIIRDSIEYRIFREYFSAFDFPRHTVYFSRKDILEMLAPEFEVLNLDHQAAPQDFLRSASWRENNFADRLIAKVFKSQFSAPISCALAWMRLTCRVSVRCRRKPGAS